MPKVRERSKDTPAKGWSSTPEIDGFTWELGPEPSPPSDADAAWAAENLNKDVRHGDAPTPDHILDLRAGEAEALDAHERGLRPC
jgi:hypothetical protein